jgi:hypothetical protein
VVSPRERQFDATGALGHQDRVALRYGDTHLLGCQYLAQLGGFALGGLGAAGVVIERLVYRVGVGIGFFFDVLALGIPLLKQAALATAKKQALVGPAES